MGADYTQFSTPQACRLKWAEGRAKYGDEFQGDPVVELDNELVDAINYAEESARQSRRLPPGLWRRLVEIREDLLAYHRAEEQERMRRGGAT